MFRYTLGYFGLLFHIADLIAFEPHPAHAKLLKRNFALNHLSTREEINAAAARKRRGSSERRGRAFDPGQRRSAGGISVPVIDFFEVVGICEIDPLKIDAKGGELSNPHG